MLTRLLASLQFRLLVSFVFVLSLALVGVSLYTGQVADREAKRLRRDVDDIRAERVQRMVSGQYAGLVEMTRLQGVLENAGSLYGWRIVVSDVDGHVVADSHQRYVGRVLPKLPGRPKIYIVARGQQVASVEVAPGVPMEGALEPSPSRLVSALNQSLVWTGLAAGVGGALMVSLFSRRLLAPVRQLRSAASSLGQGDLSQRVTDLGRDEMGDLGRTFNSMAEGLERAEQQRRDLMADVAHELRTPLSNIQGYLEAVRDGLVPADTATFETISRQTSLLSQLVEDLRVLALAEAGALRLDLAPGSIEDVLRHAVDSFGPRAGAKNIVLSIDVAGGIPPLDMDSSRITQVVVNLVDNAVLHTPEGGAVTVTAEAADGGVVRVEVADTGPGIPAEELPLVFERFYRVDPSRSRETGGAGLGLTIARQLIESHGGKIAAESAPGQGTRFIFELPVAGRGDTRHGEEQGQWR